MNELSVTYQPSPINNNLCLFIFLIGNPALFSLLLFSNLEFAYVLYSFNAMIKSRGHKSALVKLIQQKAGGWRFV